MPNIEIHGMPAKAMEMAQKIFSIFSRTKYVNDMVVTIHKTIVLDRHRNHQPFLRLLDTSQKQSMKIIKKLKSLNIDIEYQELKSFTPKSG